MNLKYCGSALDYSGYGEANRHDIAALVSAGVEVTCEIPKYTLELADFGILGQICRERANKQIDYEIKILHTTPNVYPRYIENGKYHIGRVFWETDKLPNDFAAPLHLVDEIWTGSQFNADAIRKAGVTEKPIYIIPEAIVSTPPEVEPFKSDNIKDSDFKFYSIFEWTERKNPNALLEAYWREFKDEPGVAMYIKTYVDSFSQDKRAELDQKIRKLKAKLNLDSYPPLYLYRNLMDRQQVYRFHKTFDCFVSAHRGEGWGIPQMEAMLMGNPIISTNCGGIHEYLSNNVEAKLVAHRLINIGENSRNQNWYCPDQRWADVDIDELRKAMRGMFLNKDDSKMMGAKAREKVQSTFATEVVGKQMLSRLLEIEGTL